ncbi:MAG: hypothetical protein NVS1B6_05110 [Steroidobacteraceae bacterium]
MELVKEVGDLVRVAADQVNQLAGFLHVFACETPRTVAAQRHPPDVGLGHLEDGDCFGETSYVRGAKRTATINASGAVTVMKVSSTLLEQVSAECQLRFNKVFLRSMIGRLQSPDRGGA